MRRMFGWLALALAIVSGGAAPANAAAFLWVAAPNWSYSAALASSPAGTAYFWGLSFGVGSYSYAYAFSVSPGFGGAGAFAVAQAGTGGGGAAFAAGFADPCSGVGVNVALDSPISSDSYATDGGASDQTQFAGQPSYVVGTNGITLNDSGSNLGANEQLLAFDDSGESTATEASLRTALGASSCSTDQSGQTGNVTDLSTLEADLGLGAPLFDVTDPSTGTFIPFGSAIDPSQESNIILVAEGDAIPEPASILLLAQGLSGLGLVVARRRRRRG